MSEWLRRAMEQQSLSTSKLADLVGVTPNTVTAWRTGRRSPSEGSSRKLAEIFDIEPDVVLKLAGW